MSYVLKKNKNQKPGRLLAAVGPPAGLITHHSESTHPLTEAE
jgi:hypothetical protein